MQELPGRRWCCSVEEMTTQFQGSRASRLDQIVVFESHQMLGTKPISANRLPVSRRGWISVANEHFLERAKAS